MHPLEHEIHNVMVVNSVDRIIHVKLVGRTNVTIVLKADIEAKWPNRRVKLTSTELVDDGTAGDASRESIEQVLATQEWADFANRLIQFHVPIEQGYVRETVIAREDVKVGDLIRVELWSKAMKQTREGIARFVERDCIKVNEYDYLITKNEEFNGALITRIDLPS